MCCMTVFSVFVYFVFLLGSLENVPNIQQSPQVRQNPIKKSSTAGNNVIETVMYTYHIQNRTDCNGPRLYQAYQ